MTSTPPPLFQSSPARNSPTAQNAAWASAFQPLARDFAFVVASDVAAEKLVKAAKGADKALITEVAIFDVFDDWFRQEGFESCSFITVLLEMGAGHPAGHASKRHLANIRGLLAEWAEEAGLSNPHAFAHSLHILMKGSIISAAEGDREAAQRAKRLARMLIDEHR